MSWEGYEQMICANGHFRSAGDGGPYYEVPEKCSCGAGWAERNIVDETNGCDGNPCQCGMRELEVVVPAITETCNLGHVHEIEEPKYRFGKIHTYEGLKRAIEEYNQGILDGSIVSKP